MDRAIPVGSKLLCKRQLKLGQKKHEDKLKVIQSGKSEYNFFDQKKRLIVKNGRFLKEKEMERIEVNRKLAEKISPEFALPTTVYLNLIRTLLDREPDSRETKWEEQMVLRAYQRTPGNSRKSRKS